MPDFGGGMDPMGGPQMDAPQFDGGMPPMGGDMGDPSMGMPPQDGMGGENPFDSNFDPGVDADEQTDPKHFIQQLTGKLSQSLRSYNSSLPQPDADLDKYVAGMVLKQTTEGLPEEDRNEILKKVNGNGDEEEAQIGENRIREMREIIDNDDSDNADTRRMNAGNGIHVKAVSAKIFNS